MAVTEIKKEPWCKQEGETPTQFYWFEQYLNYPYNDISKFHEAMEKECKENGKKPQKKAPLCTLKTMYNWSYQNKWIKRKNESIIWQSEDNNTYLRQLQLKDKEEESNRRHNIKMESYKKVEEGITNGSLTGYQLNQFVQAIKTLNELDLLELGEATENITQTINADVKTTSKKDKIKEVDDLAKEIQGVIDDE